MLKKVIPIVALIVIALIGAVVAQPTDYRVVRTAQVMAPPSQVHALINDFRRWDSWSPWAKIDPAMKVAHEGAPSGPGAIYKWTGNDDVGEGKMTIIDSQPGELVRIKLDFLKPFQSTSANDFHLTTEGNATRVEWSMQGKNDFMGKLFCLFTGGMDKAIGPDFEKGLAQLKAVAESNKS